jgi:hypothetical protein
LWTEGKDLQEVIYIGSRTYKRYKRLGDRIYKRPVTRGIGSKRGKFHGGWDQFHWGIGSVRNQLHGD